MSNPTRILIVDDDRDIVDAIRLVLESGGYEVFAAYDADEGLAKTEAETPDLILLDVMMPHGTEGFHLVWKLRRRKELYFRTVPIIMLTAIHKTTALRFYPETSDGTYEAGEYLSVQDFLDKPVKPQELLWRVERALALPQKP